MANNQSDTTAQRPVGKVSFQTWTAVRASASLGEGVAEIAARLRLSEKTVSDIISYKREAADGQ